MAAETYTPDNLIAGTTQTVTDSVTIAAGADLKRGSVLGKVTADGKYLLSDDGSSDGSEVPSAILAQDADAAAADVENVAIFIKGEFNQNVLIFGGAHTADSTKDALRDVGIYIKDAVKA